MRAANEELSVVPYFVVFVAASLIPPFLDSVVPRFLFSSVPSALPFFCHPFSSAIPLHSSSHWSFVKACSQIHTSTTQLEFRLQECIIPAHSRRGLIRKRYINEEGFKSNNYEIDDVCILDFLFSLRLFDKHNNEKSGLPDI